MPSSAPQNPVRALTPWLLFSDLIEGPAGLSLLDSLQSCVESFFLGLRVKCLPSIPISSIHCCYRHSQDSDRVQLHAGKDLAASWHQPGVLAPWKIGNACDIPSLPAQGGDEEGSEKGEILFPWKSQNSEAGNRNKKQSDFHHIFLCCLCFSALFRLDPARISSGGRHCRSHAG